jgi:predicted ATPase
MAQPTADGLDTPAELPTTFTGLLGRDAEIEAVARAVREHRCVTLTGPGGVGKTRLALQIEESVRDSFPDGVYFVNLAPLRDAALVVPTIAQALRLGDMGSRSMLDVVKAFVRPKRLFLLLDNFEQVVEAAPALSELLAAGPS